MISEICRTNSTGRPILQKPAKIDARPPLIALPPPANFSSIQRVLLMALFQTPQDHPSDSSAEASAFDLLRRGLEDAHRALDQLQEPRQLRQIQRAASMLSRCFAQGGKLILAGNGGSLCDAMHMAEELTGYFRNRRPALPALALSDPGHLSCVANDTGFDQVFSRGIEALGRGGDVFAGLTTSGNSENLKRAFEVAKAQKMRTIAFLGKDGGALRDVADVEIFLKGRYESDRIQEAHMTAIHLIIELCEKELFAPQCNAPLI